MSAFAQACTAVLVHGAWADGSCWSNLVLPLRHAGLNVVAAPLPLTSLSDDAASLRRVLARVDEPVVLVGHAYGGAVIGAVQDDRVKSLVYVAALAPDEGETVADVFYRTAPHPKAPQLKPDADGLIWMPDDGFHDAVAHKASLDEAVIMAAVQRPIAVNCIQEKASAVAWKTKPSWYLLAEEDRMIAEENQRFMAERMGATIRPHAVDHTPMYTAPQFVIEIVLEAANQAMAAMN